MAKITAKDNFLKLFKGEMPAYVPFFTFTGAETVPEVSYKTAAPGLFKTNPPNPDGSVTNMWGVTSYPTYGTQGANMPDPTKILLEDINDWREVLMDKPNFKDDLSKEGFEAMAKADLERIKIDRTQTALGSSCGFGPWMALIGFMGFEGAMLNMALETETVKELLDWELSLYLPYIELALDAYQPDIWVLSDDICTERAPFFSVAMLQDLFVPIYKRLVAPAVERGIPIMMHICGMIEPFVPDLIDVGVRCVEPAQQVNDIQGLKEKYPNQMAYAGGYDWPKHMPDNYPDYDKEALVQDLREYIDEYAPGGMFASRVNPISFPGDPNIAELKQLLWDECLAYGKTFYGYSE